MWLATNIFLVLKTYGTNCLRCTIYHYIPIKKMICWSVSFTKNWHNWPITDHPKPQEQWNSVTSSSYLRILPFSILWLANLVLNNEGCMFQEHARRVVGPGGCICLSIPVMGLHIYRFFKYISYCHRQHLYWGFTRFSGFQQTYVLGQVWLQKTFCS